MGYPHELAAAALRCTTGRSTTPEEIDAAAAVIAGAVARMRDRTRAHPAGVGS